MTISSKLKALLFDLDGTLSDTTSVHYETWVEVLEPYGYDVTWDFYRDRISGRLTPEVVADLFPNLSDEEAQELAEKKEVQFREQAEHLEPLPGLLDLVEKGRERGMGIALVTNAPKDNVFTVLNVLGLGDAFDPMVIAEELGVGKPDPGPYQAALEALSISPDEAVAFEDSPSGIASSVDAGIPTVGIASVHDPEDLEELGVDLVAQDFADPKLETFIDSR